MLPFRKLFGPGPESGREQIEYKPVDFQGDDEGLPLADRASVTALAKVQKRLTFYRTAFFLTHAFQALFFVVWLVRDAPQPHVTYRDLEWSGLLGEDWNGLVPNGKPGRTPTTQCNSRLCPSIPTDAVW